MVVVSRGELGAGGRIPSPSPQTTSAFTRETKTVSDDSPLQTSLPCH